MRAPPSFKTFRNLDARARFLGLEIEDWGILVLSIGLTLGLPISLFSALIIVGCLWSWMFFVKTRRPPGWTESLLKYLVSPKVLDVGLEFKDARKP